MDAGVQGVIAIDLLLTTKQQIILVIGTAGRNLSGNVHWANASEAKQLDEIVW